MRVKISQWKKISISLLVAVGVFAFLIISTQAAEQSDAIAVRIMPNPNHDSIDDWYAKQGFRGAPQSLIVDGYEAIRDGRTVFINAANLDLSQNKLYTNIYLISYNQDSTEKTSDILGQLVSHWKFNGNVSTLGRCTISNQNCQADTDCASGYLCSNSTNYGNQGKCILKDDKVCLIDSDCPVNLFCDSLKAKATRDVKRLGEFNKIKTGIDAYYQANGKTYPNIQSGSYVAGKTISLWPSWQETFWPQLKLDQLLVDPINTLGYCAGYDPATCWSKDKNEFVNSDLTLPFGSYAFVYSAAKNGVNYDLCTVFETKAAGYDTAEGQLSSGSCAVGSGYGSLTGNTAPYLKSAILEGETGKEFNGYINALDAEGDVISWSVNEVTTSTDWLGWSAIPVLKDLGNGNQKKLYSAKAGDAGVYKMLLTLKDSRNASSSAELIINIAPANKPKIEADDIDYFVDPVNKLNYTFYVQGTNSLPTFTFKPVNAGDLNLNSYSPTIATTTIGVNRTKVDFSVLIPTSVAITGNMQIPYLITANEKGVTSTKQVNINLKMEQPYLDFQCENMARLGSAYQISSDGSPRSCLLGGLKSGNHSFSYSVDGPVGLKIRYDANNAYLEAAAISVPDTEVGKPSPVKVKIKNEYSATNEKNFDLKVNNYCGDGIRQKNIEGNTEGRGGLYNDGVEECDGSEGVQTASISTSSAFQYGCTTEADSAGIIKSPYPIVDNNSCVFKSAENGGGFCGDGVCQFQIMAGGQSKQMENCWNCSQDCGTCLATVSSKADQEQIAYFNGKRLYKEQTKDLLDTATTTFFSSDNVFAFWTHNLNDADYGLTFKVKFGPVPTDLNPNPTSFGELDSISVNLKCSNDPVGGGPDLSADTYNPASYERDNTFNWTEAGYNNINKTWLKPVVNSSKPSFNGSPYIWSLDTPVAGGAMYCRLPFTYLPYNTVSCQPITAGKTCGTDGCGNSIGTCKSNETCSTSGNCVCQPNCSNKCGGSDGCGGTCVDKCVSPETCGGSGIPNVCGSQSDVCTSNCNQIPVCVSDCTNKCGGSDGCGRICPDTCMDTVINGSPTHCLAPMYTKCVETSSSQCNAYKCSPAHCGQADGCGNICGCGPGQYCNGNWCINTGDSIFMDSLN